MSKIKDELIGKYDKGFEDKIMYQGLKKYEREIEKIIATQKPQIEAVANLLEDLNN